LIARIDNLRGLDENQKGVNRPFRFGVYPLIRLLRQEWCPNRTDSDPPPIVKAGGLADRAVLLIQ